MLQSIKELLAGVDWGATSRKAIAQQQTLSSLPQPTMLNL